MRKLHDIRLIAILIVAGAWTLTHASAVHGRSMNTVDVEARFLFIPQGFDNNDQTEVVIDGFLPNACYTPVTPVVEFDAAQNVFTIRPQANRLEGEDVVCSTFEVPYTETAVLGVLKPGTYTVTAAGTDKKMLRIGRSATVGPDDFLYAPVALVNVDVELNPRKITAKISGHYNNTCMSWSETRILDQGETVVILPIVKMAERADCKPAEIAFNDVTVTLPWRGPGRYLLHTRGFNGSAVNSMFTVEGE